MYKAENSVIKESVRDILFKEIDSNWSEGKGKISLTLPNKNFSLEKRLRTRGSVTCFERDKRVYKAASKVRPANVTLLNDNVFNYNPKDNLDFVWLDLCNAYSEEILTNVAGFLKRINFNENGVFAITFMKNRGSISGSELTKYYSHFKKRGVVQYLGNFIKNEIKEVKKVEYNCFDISTKSSPMTLLIFKLGKI